MALLSRLRLGKDRETEALHHQTEALQQHVSHLQAALKQCAEVAGRWRHFGREVTAAVAVLMLALGFALGVYREPIGHAFTHVLQVAGLGSLGGGVADPYAAYQDRNYAAAVRLARPLADSGDARAESLLGQVYYHGRGEKQDDGEAAKWFRRAADKGDAAAEFYLGVMYAQGQGVPQDNAEAVRWYRLSAEQGDPHAQYNLGLSYATGDAGETDNVAAYMWFDLAAARFPDTDPGRRAAISSRNQLTDQMTRDQIAEAQKRAREWKPK